MNNHFTRIASLVLAFGFFISCSTLHPNNKTQQSPATKDLSESQVRQRIDSVDKQLANDRQSPDLFYRKGSLLTKLAQKQVDPSQRLSFYRNARQSLEKADALYKNKTSTPDTDKAKQLLKITWSNEHNQGVQIMQSDTTTDAPDYQQAAAHFRNATVIIPDSAISYKMQAKALYKNQKLQKAIDVLEKARANIKDLPPMMMEQLAFLYLEDEQTQKAVQVYEQAESFSGRNLNLLHGLSNAYISAGEHQKAAELLEHLVRRKPENIIYKESFATELYMVAAQKFEQVIANLREGKPLQDTQFDEADSLISTAEQQFKQTLSQNSKDNELKLSFARFYQNSASKYQRLLPFVKNDQKTELQDKIKNYVRASVPLLEQLAGQDSVEHHIWRNLYQAYSYLGMKEKAKNAKSNL